MREPDEPNKVNEPRPAPHAPADDAPGLGPDLQALEAEWARLRPRAAAIDRDRLLYLAGWAAAEAAAIHLPTSNRGRVARLAWPTALGGVSAIAAALLGMLLVRPAPTVVERLVYVKQDSAGDSSETNRSFAQDAARGAPEMTPEGDQRIWTVGRLLRPGSLTVARRGDDLLPLEADLEIDAATPARDFRSIENLRVLSPRSLNSFLDEDPRTSNGAVHPSCHTPNAQEPSYDL